MAMLGHGRDEPSRHANLYDMSKRVSEGGLTFRARFGVERDGDNLLAEGVYSLIRIFRTDIPEFTMQMLMDLGWDGDLTGGRTRRHSTAVAGPKTNWKTRPFGRYPAGGNCA